MSNRNRQSVQFGADEPPICANARSAIARNSPAAPGLVNQCNTQAGRQVLAPMAAYVSSGGPTALVGRMYAEDISAIKGYAAKGAALASSNSSVAAARALVADGNYRWGFDVASGLCQGMWSPGPGQSALRGKLGPFYSHGPNGAKGSNEAMKGFDVGQALQHGISKADNELKAAMASALPNEAAGMLIAAGISGSGSPVDTKVGAMEIVASNAGAAAGASQVIAKKQGLWASILAFFGL